MPDTGFIDFTTFANDASVGDSAWVNPSNAAASDDTRAISDVLSSSTSQRLTATDTASKVPVGAIIRGVEINLERQSITGGRISDFEVSLIKAGTVSGDNKAIPAATQQWPTVEAVQGYGGAADLWGLALLDTDVNASNFGVSIRAENTEASPDNAEVDHIQVKIHFDPHPGLFFMTL